MDTSITRLLGTKTPIISAPMAGPSGGELAARVSIAGGFGFIGAGYQGKESFCKELNLARSILQQDVSPNRASSAPDGSQEPLKIGVGFIGWTLDKSDDGGKIAELLSIALEARVAAIWLAFGSDLGKWVQVVRRSDEGKAQPRKTKVFVLVNSLEEAQKAVREWDADVLVAQGIEAGGHGHGAAPPLLDLVPEILNWLNTVPPTNQDEELSPPVIAAGGVSTGTQIAALLALGAAGVAMGTRFLLTPEALYSNAQKAALLAANGTSTVRTLAFDAMRGTLGWPAGIDGRGLKNKVVERYENGEDVEIVREMYEKATREGNRDGMLVWSGAGVGLINQIEPAADLVTRLHREAETRLREIPSLLSVSARSRHVINAQNSCYET